MRGGAGAEVTTNDVRSILRYLTSDQEFAVNSLSEWLLCPHVSGSFISPVLQSILGPDWSAQPNAGL